MRLSRAVGDYVSPLAASVNFTDAKAGERYSEALSRSEEGLASRPTLLYIIYIYLSQVKIFALNSLFFPLMCDIGVLFTIPLC